MPESSGFDRGAAVTRSMLGWGVVAGVFYLVVGLVLALTRPGFDLSQHALSLLLLGEHGWIQALNLILSGLMTIVAAIGFSRLPNPPRAGAVLIGVYGACLVLSAVFRPDPVDGFPPGSVGGTASAAGILHIACGGIGFLSLAAAAFLVGGWFSRRHARRPALWSRIAGSVVIVGFFGGAALAQSSTGIALLWLAVLVGWAWLAFASVVAYRAVPHPIIAQRAGAGTGAIA